MPPVVSFGYGCQVSHQIRRAVGQDGSLPFDWIITPKAALFEIVSAGFTPLMRLSDLARDINGVVTDRLGVQFHHDFSAFNQIEIAAAQEKYTRRSNRLIEMLNSQKAVTLIRQGEPGCDSMSLDESRRLLTLMRGQFPHCRIRLVVFNPIGAEGCSDDGDIIMREFRRPEPYVWTGDDGWWDGALREVIAA